MAIKKNRLVFVVEDDKIYNKLIVDFLKKNGFKRVETFFCGNDFLDALASGKHPDIVIQDYFLDDFTGTNILKEVKQKNKHTKFIFLTAHKDMTVAVDAIKLGAVDYIVKEDSDALTRMLREVLRASKMLEVEKRNMFVKNAMIISLIILVGIVVFVVLNNIFVLV